MSRILVDPPELRDGRIHWRGRLVTAAGESEVFYEFQVPGADRFVPTARPFLLTFLLPAMRAGEPLHLEGGLDAITRRNLYEWQRAYAGSLANLEVVEIIEDGEPARLPARDGTLTAFSGGVDSCFSALRPAGCELGPVPEVSAALMVHGFDIPLDDRTHFDGAFARSERLLDESGIRLLRMRTNSREAVDRLGFQWDRDSHGIILAAALSCLEPYFGTILIPSSYNYPVTKFPWGSGPASDHLYGSRDTDWWHDGAAYHKLDKVLALAEIGTIRRNMRVCWAGSELDRNCGHCFKCIATQVCFWIGGFRTPEAFDSPCDLRDVAHAPLHDTYTEYLFKVFQKAAKARGMEAVARACRAARRRYRRMRFARKLPSPLRRLAANLPA